MVKTWTVALTVGALGLVASAVFLASPSRAATGVVFEVTIQKGQIVLNDVIVNPGVKPPVSKFKGKDVEKCVRGEGDSFCAQYIENDAAGRFYLYCDDRENWRFATNPDGVMTTALEGNLDPVGNFMYAGTHSLSGMRLFFTGKAKLQKGTFTPASLKGSAYFTSPTIKEFGSVSFTAKPVTE